MTNVFLDSNICVYAFDLADTRKRDIAIGLLLEGNAVISSQVIIETYLTSSKKLKIDNLVLNENTSIMLEYAQLVPIDLSVFTLALKLRKRYLFSFLDSVIVATALHAGCSILHTEDLQHNQRIFDQLTIINPFV